MTWGYDSHQNMVREERLVGGATLYLRQFGYDAADNPLNADGLPLTYDANSEPKESSFEYDADGLPKRYLGETVSYDAAGDYASNARYSLINFAGGLPARKTTSASKVTHYLYDVAGNVVCEITSTGTVYGAYAYGPFGLVQRWNGVRTTPGYDQFAFDLFGNVAVRQWQYELEVDASEVYDSYGRVVARYNVQADNTEPVTDPIGPGGQWGERMEEEDRASAMPAPGISPPSQAQKVRSGKKVRSASTREPVVSPTLLQTLAADWDWGQYFGDAGGVMQGYGDVLVGTVTAPYDITSYFFREGLSISSTGRLLEGMWTGFASGITGERGARGFGESFGTVLMTIAPAMKRVPIPRIGRSVGKAVDASAPKVLQFTARFDSESAAHIAARHYAKGAESAKASIFTEGTNIRTIRSLAEEAFRSGSYTQGKNGALLIEKSFKQVVGNTAKGKSIRGIRVVVKDGRIVTVYPIK